MNFSSKLRDTLFGSATKNIWLVIGLLLIIIGQSIIREPQALNSFKTITDLTNHWNKIFYLDLKNPANITVGLFLIGLALLIYYRLFALKRKTNDQELHIGNMDLPVWKNQAPWLIANLALYIILMFLFAQHQYSTLLLILWLISILIFTFIFWKNEYRNKTLSGDPLTYLDTVRMLALFAFAIAAGSYLLNDLPAGWITDEGPFWKLARSIALGESNPPFFDFGVFSFPVSSSVLQGLIMRWVGVDMWGWRFASVLPAAMTVFPLYLLTRELFDRRVAVAANLMMIVNPYFLTFARLGYNNSQSLFPVTLCVFFLVLGIRRNNYFYLWLSGLVAGLGFYAYFAAWLGLVILVIVPLCYVLINRVKFQNIFLPLSFIVIGAVVVLLPRFLYGISSDSPKLLHFKIWETGMVNTFYGYQTFGEERMNQAHILMLNEEIGVFYDLSLYGILFLRGLVRTISSFFDPLGYFDHQIVFGLAGPVSSIFFIMGLGIVFANFKKTQYLILAVWFLTGFLLLGVLASLPPRPTHMVAIIPVMSIISAIGLITFLDNIIQVKTNQVKYIFSWKNIAIGGSLLIITTSGLFQFFFLIPYAYLPINADDYISWLGRQIPQPANIFLIDHYSYTRNPNAESLLKLSQHRTSFITQDKLLSNPDQMETWHNFVAFIDPQTGKEYAEWIAQKIPGSHVYAAYAPGKRLRGYIITDLKVNVSMDISLSYGLQSLWNSPARLILVSCGTGIILILLFNRINFSVISKSK